MLLLWRYAERLQVQSSDHLDAEDLKFTSVITSYLPLTVTTQVNAKYFSRSLRHNQYQRLEQCALTALQGQILNTWSISCRGFLNADETESKRFVFGTGSTGGIH